MKSSTQERDMRKHTLTAICAAAALAAALPMSAQAGPTGGLAFKQANFKATLSGSQVTTWEYHKPDDPDNQCDAGSDGYGDQTIKFSAGRAFRLSFTAPPKNRPNFFLTGGRPSVFSTPLLLPVDATAERNGDYSVHYEQTSQNCPGVGSGGGVTEQPAKDCGVRHGGFQTRLYFRDSSPDAGLVVPIGRPLPEKNTLKLEGNAYEWLSGDGSASELDGTYARCPLLLDSGYVERAGNIWTSGAHLSEKTLFNAKRKKIVVSGDTIQKFHSGTSTGQTIIAWNLRLTRVK
jgi:hypothetical protein